MTLFFRTTGTLGAPGFIVNRPTGLLGNLGRVRLSVTVGILERPDGIVLIDAGWSRKTCAWPHDDPGWLTTRFLGLQVQPEDAIASQLISCGYNPDDVRHVIATHLHLDHVGGVADFPGAQVHAARAEWTAAQRGWREGYTLRALPDPKRLVLHDLKGPAALGFPASHDLFGDGSVLLLDAGGHTRGSLAVALRLEQGCCLHAGDAAMFHDEYRRADTGPSPRWPSPYARIVSRDLGQQRATFNSLRVAEREHGARVVLAHDLEGYEALPRSREEGWKTPHKSPRAVKGKKG